MNYPKPILDDAHFEKFVGGIKTPYTFIDEFHGFIGSLRISQNGHDLPPSYPTSLDDLNDPSAFSDLSELAGLDYLDYISHGSIVR